MPGSTPATSTGPRRAVLDMGASAIRLVVAEIQPRQPVRILEEATRGVPLGRDAFSTRRHPSRHRRHRRCRRSTGSARFSTATASCRSARSPRARCARRATATCSSTAFAARTGIAFEIINEAEESRLVLPGRPAAAGRHSPRSRAHGRWSSKSAAAASDLTLLRRGRPNRSGVYALGAIRMRQQLNLKRHSREMQVSLLKRYIANVIEEIRVDIPLDRVTHVIAIGGDVRFAAAQLRDRRARRDARRFRARSSWRSAIRSKRPGRETPGRSVPAAGRRGRNAGAGAAGLSRAARRDGRAPARRVRRVASRRRAARHGRAGRPAGRGGLRAAGARQRRRARREVPLRPPARPPRRHARRPSCSTRCARNTASADASGCCCRWPRCCTTSACSSACARTTSTRSTCCRRRRSSG